jgi:hypothetical protein
MLGDILVVTAMIEVTEQSLVGRGQRCWSTSCGAQESPPQRIIQVKMSCMLWLKNTDVGPLFRPSPWQCLSNVSSFLFLAGYPGLLLHRPKSVFSHRRLLL